MLSFLSNAKTGKVKNIIHGYCIRCKCIKKSKGMVNTNFLKHLKVLHLVLYLKLFYFKIYIVSYFIIMSQITQKSKKNGIKWHFLSIVDVPVHRTLMDYLRISYS